MKDASQQLEEHLHTYGIQKFDSERELPDGADDLDIDLLMQVDDLNDSNPDRRRFYNFISSPHIAGVVHSEKADRILSSGGRLDSALPQECRVLDIGCNIGYLTTFYAIRSSRRHVVGCDNSGDSILRAVEESQKRNIDNVEFIVADIREELPAGTYDAITSSQTLSDVKNNRQDALKRIVESLSPTGVIFSVEAFEKAELAASYIDDAAACGLALQSLEFVPFNDPGAKGAYPFFEFRQGGQELTIDLDAMYQELLDSFSDPPDAE
jgi:SAM-dependent methyltransferase